MAAPSAAPSTPYGVMTGFAKDIELAVGKCELPGKTNRFLSEMKVRSFGNAGWQKESEQPSLWCFFDLSKWCEAINVSKSTLLHIRQRLEDDCIITFESDGPGTGTGKLYWNINLAQWKPLQSEYVRWGGNRKQSNIVHLNEKRESASREQSTVDAIASREQSQIAINAFKGTKAASYESSAGQAAQTSLRRDTEEEYTNKNVSANAPHIEQAQLLPIATETKKPVRASGSKKSYIFDALYYKLVDIFGKPLGGAKHYWHQTVLPGLREDGITPEQLEQAAKAYKERYASKGLAFTVKAVFNNLSDLLSAPLAPAKPEKPQTSGGIYSYNITPTYQGGF